MLPGNDKYFGHRHPPRRCFDTSWQGDKPNGTAHHWYPDTRPPEYTENAPDTSLKLPEISQKAPYSAKAGHQNPEHCFALTFLRKAECRRESSGKSVLTFTTSSVIG